MIELAFVFVLLMGAGGTGHYLLRRLGYAFHSWIEAFSFAVASGLGVLMLAVLGLGLCHLLYWQVIYGLVLVWGGIGCREVLPLLATLRERAKSIGTQVIPGSFDFWLVALTGLGSLLILLRALVPPYGATDPLAYHLALPKIFLQKHYLSFEPTITGALYPTNLGLLYLVGLALRNGILAQVIHWLMSVLCLVALVGFGRQYFSVTIGVWAAVIFGFLPIVVTFGPMAYVDIGLCFFQFMAFWALINWLDRADIKTLILAAMLAGLSMGVKHQGIATAVVGAGIVLGGSLWTRRGVFGALVTTGMYLGLAFAIVAPWYARSYLLGGNPIWPLANDFFKGISLEAVANRGGEGTQQSDPFWNLIPSVAWFRNYWESMSPLNWTFNPSGQQKAIGIYFIGLLPGLALFARRKKHFLLIGFCLFYFLILVRFLHMNPRYGLVLFAFLAVLCGCVAEGVTNSRMKPVSLLFKGWFLGTLLLNLIWMFFLAKPVASVALNLQDREVFLRAHEGNYRLFQEINRTVPSSGKILLQGIVKGFYCDRSYLWDHPHRGLNYSDYSSPEELLSRFEELGITHIARMIQIPPGRTNLGYPQYFADPFHESFRKKYLKLIYRDESYVLFEVQYPG